MMLSLLHNAGEGGEGYKVALQGQPVFAVSADLIMRKSTLGSIRRR